MKVVNLQCEYKQNPIGIGVKKPRFCYQVASSEQNSRQEYYRICVYDKNNQNKLVWDSGKTQCQKTFGIEYDGEELTAFTQYDWVVETWDNYGNHALSDIAQFETGLFSLDDWKSKWITAKHAENCIHFRSSFTLPKDKKVLSARLYSASTAGAFGDVTFAMNTVYLTLNGKKVGNDAIMPGQISIKRNRAVYRTFDVTSQLLQGESVVGAVLVSMAYSAFVRVCFEDGTTQIFPLMDACKVNANGPYTLWDVGVGEQGGKKEDYNPFNEYKGFDQPNYDDTGWKAPVYTDVVTCLEEQMVTVEPIEELKPVSIRDKWIRHYLVDFGQVINGHVKLIIKSPKKKQRISVVYSEGVYSDGQLEPFSTMNYQHGENGPHTDTYVTVGDSDQEIFEPKFSNHSFRYVDVYNYTGEFDEECIRAVVVHSPIINKSGFSCSDEEINSLYSISRWSERDNLVAIPTDCPGRERLGWMADAWLCCEAELLNFDLIKLMESWCRTIRDEQLSNGYVPYICPPPSPIDNVDVPWSAACVFIPWFVFERYGDKRILQENYPVMEKWIAFMDTLADQDYRMVGGILWGDHTQQVESNRNYLATAYYCLCCDYMIKVCNALGKDCSKYQKSSQMAKQAIVKLYKTEDGICNNTQCEISLALALGIIEQAKGIELLEKDLIKTGYLMTCGGLGIYHLITELEKAGRNDLIYAICKCDKEGSYLSWIKNHGATTSFEGLHFYQAYSRNHPFLMGSVTTWFYQGLAGIKKTSAGYETFDIKPYIPCEMENLSVCVDTYYGAIEFSYKRTDKTTVYKINVPFGTTANFYIPNGKDNKEEVVKLGSGEYRMEIEEKTHIDTFKKIW